MRLHRGDVEAVADHEGHGPDGVEMRPGPVATLGRLEHAVEGLEEASGLAVSRRGGRVRTRLRVRPDLRA